MRAMELLFYLLAVHALTDYVLQPDWMAKHKSPRHPPPASLGKWWWIMGAHGLVNGLGVAVVTHLWWVGLAETIAHIAIDLGKCRHQLRPEEDQILHLACKGLWVYLAL